MSGTIMALPDEEDGEILSHCVSDYHFVDENDAPVSFSNLPVFWGENQILNEPETPLVLRGTCNDGIHTVYMPVIAWKFGLCYVHPEISVLTKQRKWIMLQKPRKAFEPTIRTILITVHWLHFIKKNPDSPPLSAWKHLLKASSLFQPSVNDLLGHKELIFKAARQDKDIEESKGFLTFAGKSQTGIADKDVEATIGDDDDDGKEEIFDKVCAICDDGGNILCCNGRCLRSFHPTVADGVESACASLGYRNKAGYEAIPVFQCENCIHEQHQCFACGRMGSSARSSSQEVFPCATAACGHFYHPECVARLLHTGNEIEADKLRDKIVAGESFTCPTHRCFICKEPEVVDVYELQFAICRRCPKAYHRKCLPRDFVFQHQSDENNLARAWEGLLSNKRILIYCMEHKINMRLKTPARNHLIFPGGVRRHTSELIAGQAASAMSKRTKDLCGFSMDVPATKKLRQIDRLYDDVEIYGASLKRKGHSSEGLKPLRKLNIIDPVQKTLNKTSSIHARSFTEDDTFRNNLSVGSSSLKSKQQNIASSKDKSHVPEKPAVKETKMSLPLRDAEMEKRIQTLMESISSSFDVEEFKKRNFPDTHLSSKIKVYKSITLGLVEGSVEAVQTVMQMLGRGCRIEDAKTVCPPEVLRQIFNWKLEFHGAALLSDDFGIPCQTKLKVYLAPFLYGARYTSFGRHFTQIEKLKEVVDCVQWYVQDHDMIVDFCCGSNDFSCLLKERLQKTGKNCLFKNYDIIQAKNDFSFEKKDWMKVRRDELPDGSRLIMGLNPPFGVNASLANKFINKALEFSPKLIVLIVPKETQRLDEKAPYDLIWQDDWLLSGKSFYLPGSVNMNDKQIDQWNNIPPPLYLWSHCNWTAMHMAIARQRGHII